MSMQEVSEDGGETRNEQQTFTKMATTLPAPTEEVTPSSSSFSFLVPGSDLVVDSSAFCIPVDNCINVINNEDVIDSQW